MYIFILQLGAKTEEDDYPETEGERHRAEMARNDLAVQVLFVQVQRLDRTVSILLQTIYIYSLVMSTTY